MKAWFSLGQSRVTAKTAATPGYGIGTVCRNPNAEREGQFAKFFSANCPFEFADFCSDNLPNT